jgi:hypothetical protein
VLLSVWYVKTFCSQFSPTVTTTKPSSPYLLVSDIPKQNVPGYREDVERGSELDKRIIIVGDVHGMFDECTFFVPPLRLRKLLAGC